MYSRFSAVVRFSEPPLGTRFRALVGQPCAPTPQSWHRIPGVAANIGHIVSLTFFAGAIAVMDVRLLGGLAATAPGPLLARARLVAIAALAGMAGTAFFCSPPRSLNPVFQLKAILVVAGLINVAIYELWAKRAVAQLAPGAAMPARAKVAGGLSLGIWVAVAACGRSIAYF